VISPVNSFGNGWIAKVFKDVFHQKYQDFKQKCMAVLLFAFNLKVKINLTLYYRYKVKFAFKGDCVSEES
jgi:hypothetical protein